MRLTLAMCAGALVGGLVARYVNVVLGFVIFGVTIAVLGRRS